jgi:hypothetical protein
LMREKYIDRNMGRGNNYFIFLPQS